MGPAFLKTIGRIVGGLAASLVTGCLLVTPLDGLAGPPLGPDGGGSESGGDASTSDVPTDAPSRGPFIVIGVGGTLRGIAEHGTDLYWVQTGTAAGIARAPKQGGPAALVQQTSDAFDVGVDGEYVYWSTGKGNEVFRKAMAGGASSGEPYFPGAGETLYLAVGTQGRVFVTGPDNVAVGPRADAGTSDALYLFQTGASGLALTGTDLYWGVATGIIHGSITGQSPTEPVARVTSAVTAVATDGRDIYYIDGAGVVRAVALTDPTATTPREVCRGQAPAPFDIAVDDQWVYFTEPAAGQISKCSKQ